MKNILTLFLFLIVLNVTAQLPYSWVPGVDPGWFSVNAGSGGTLQWNATCNAVTTNCNGQYSNDQNTTYTSFILDVSCINASTVNISFFISGNVEYGWDFLFMEYSLDGGVTWINPYGVNIGLTGNAGAGLTWLLPPIPVSTTFRFRFNFVSDGSVRSSGYRITDFQISCNVVLPIELLSFTGKQNKYHNDIEWITTSEINNDYFILERSNDGENWEKIYFIHGAGNSNQNIKYDFKDYNFKNDINYYRLTQFDFDGVGRESFVISVNNNNNEKRLIKTTIYDYMGRIINERDKTGFYIIHNEYETETEIIKMINN